MNKRTFVKKGMLAAALAMEPASLFPFGRLEGYSTKWPIVDTHMHLWDLSVMDYPWLEGRGQPLERNYLLQDYREATKNSPVSKMVFVECGRAPEQYLREVDWVRGLSEEDPRIAGMVAYFPLEKGTAGLEAMEEMAQRDIVRGIRKPFLPENPGYIQGIALLRKFQWVCEVNMGPGQLRGFLDLVKKFPEQVFILDHMANPDIQNQDWRDWAKALKPFAPMKQVYCKVSGMLTHASENWELSDLQSYFDTVLEAFGADRLFYGGDWPVVLRAGSLYQWMTTFYALSQALSPEEKKKLFYRNAELVYRV